MTNFWEKLKKLSDGRQGRPFFCLAPMADVTDAAFRRIIAKHEKPDVFWTEFVSADGLMSPGRKILKKNLMFTKKERPLVVQLFSANPQKMRQAASYCATLGFDGIDINMGCPDRNIIKQGSGSALIKDYERAALIISAAKYGVKDSNKEIPVSVKTRIGFNKNEVESWVPFLLKQNISALIIHGRTRKEMSKVNTHWDVIKRVVEIRDEMKVNTLIIGNGDVKNLEEGRRLAKETGCDGIMIGRGIFGNPWFFKPLHNNRSKINSKFSQVLGRGGREPGPDHSKILIDFSPITKEKLKVMVEHTKLFEKLLGDYKKFAIMKKHYKAYVNGFDGAKELRMKLMESSNAKGVEKIVKDFLKNL